jgi:kynurenine formamidase
VQEWVVRYVPDQPIRPWSPPEYTVDAQGKVVGAAPGTPNNWGRWGNDDQKGTANLLTPERVAAAARLVRSGKRFALGLPIGNTIPNIGSRATTQHIMHRPLSDAIVGDVPGHGVESSDDMVIMALQASTQLDAHAHFSGGHTLYNGFWSGLVTGHSGARRLGVHHHANGIVGRGVLLDVARVFNIDPFGTAIDAAMLDETTKTHGVSIGKGDIVLVRTGWLGTWWDQPETRKRRRNAGLAIDTIDWLAGHDVAMVAADNRTVEVIPGPADLPNLPFHQAAIRDLGLLLGELFELDELADDCADDGIYEFLFVAEPLPVVGGVGSPLNPLAIK